MKPYVDFLFIYEVKNRELENICLLRYELESRGYSVAFIGIWENIGKCKLRIDAGVVVSAALYNDETYRSLANYCGKFSKVINLQWEQIGTVSDKSNALSILHISGIPQKAVHIAWGNITYERLISCGLFDRNIRVLGHVGMDFLDKKMQSYYMTKEELFSRYNIPFDKKVCLFISSFTTTEAQENENTGKEGMTEYIEKYTSLDVNEFILSHTESKKRILEWVETLLCERDDIIFIYRPHPAEYISVEFQTLFSSVRNCYIISELSVKQWIIACDVITMWYSTSLAEVFFAGKTCHILRPVEIPIDMELELYEDAEFITNYNSFKTIFSSDSYRFPVRESVIREYFTQNEKLNYLGICDIFEEVLKDNTYTIPKPPRKPLSIIVKEKLITTRLMKIIAKTLGSRIKYFDILNRKHYENTYFSQMKDRNATTGFEIDSIMNKIKKCFQ